MRRHHALAGQVQASGTLTTARRAAPTSRSSLLGAPIERTVRVWFGPTRTNLLLGVERERGVMDSVDDFVRKRILPEFHDIVAMLRALMRECAPLATEQISYGLPMWNGKWRRWTTMRDEGTYSPAQASAWPAMRAVLNR
jgi:hypothetical protein